MIKTDPSQTKAVVVLLLILAGAVVWTITRVNPGVQPQAAAKDPATETAQASPATATIVPAFQSSRNPFRKPEGVSGRIGRDGASGGDSGVASIREGVGRTSNNFKIDPMPVGMVPSAGPDRTGVQTSEPNAGTPNSGPEKPQFALLATVGGPNGFSAVIRCGEANTRVVAVGDVLEGGYRVEKLEEDRAVLKGGRDVVVVKRPNS